MGLDKLDRALSIELSELQVSGRAKSPERIINGYVAPQGNIGPRYKVEGHDQEFIRMNSNSYLSLSRHPKMIKAADEATHKYGVGPGAVRFIDGTFEQHIKLEKDIAKFVGTPAAKIFNSAYTSNLALALTLSGPETYWIGDELNHNSIIRSMRISNVPRSNRAIFKHNDMTDLRRCLDQVPTGMKRVLVVFDGIFSMRGDNAPLQEIDQLCKAYHDKFEQGVITIVDDSHGIAAYGKGGRGTCGFTDTMADIIVGTFGKAFGVNGGFIAGSDMLNETIRQKADTYIYTNPLSVADCAAASQSIAIVDSQEGKDLLSNVDARVRQFRNGIDTLGYESIPGPHPVVPILIRDTNKTHAVVQSLFEKGVLVVGLTFPSCSQRDQKLYVYRLMLG